MSPSLGEKRDRWTRWLGTLPEADLYDLAGFAHTTCGALTPISFPGQEWVDLDDGLIPVCSGCRFEVTDPMVSAEPLYRRTPDRE